VNLIEAPILVGDDHLRGYRILVRLMCVCVVSVEEPYLIAFFNWDLEI